MSLSLKTRYQKTPSICPWIQLNEWSVVCNPPSPLIIILTRACARVCVPPTLLSVLCVCVRDIDELKEKYYLDTLTRCFVVDDEMMIVYF